MSILPDLAEHPSTVAGEPFNNPDADITIRTSNNINFKVFKVILCQASPFFQTMFTLPNGPETRRRVVSVTEDDKTMDTILRICYPIPKPPVNFTTLAHVFKAGRKYEMEAVTQYALTGVKDLIQSHPVHAYSLAYTFGLKDEAIAAAKSSLRFTLTDLLALLTYFEGSHGLAVRSLVLYHTQCRNASISIIRASMSTSEPYFWYTSHHTLHIMPLQLPHRRFVPCLPRTSSAISQAWFQDYMSSLIVTFDEQPLGDGWAECKERMAQRFMGVSDGACTDCRSKATTDIIAFLEDLRRKVETAHSEVILDITDIIE